MTSRGLPNEQIARTMVSALGRAQPADRMVFPRERARLMFPLGSISLWWIAYALHFMMPHFFAWCGRWAGLVTEV